MFCDWTPRTINVRRKIGKCEIYNRAQEWCETSHVMAVEIFRISAVDLIVYVLLFATIVSEYSLMIFQLKNNTNCKSEITSKPISQKVTVCTRRDVKLFFQSQNLMDDWNLKEYCEEYENRKYQ